MEKMSNAVLTENTAMLAVQNLGGYHGLNKRQMKLFS